MAVSRWSPRRLASHRSCRWRSGCYETVKLHWEERFEQRYGYWRGLTDAAVAKYLDCGLFDNGFARCSTLASVAGR